MIADRKIIHNLINLDIKKMKIVSYEQTDKKHIFTVKGKWQSCECPVCKKKTTKRKDRSETLLKPLWKHMYFSDGKMVEFKLIKRYFRCPDCKVAFMERFEFEAEKWERTKTFENFIVYSWWHMSWNQLAKETQSCPWLVYDILKTIDEEQLNKQGRKIMEELDEIYLGIDEHSFKGRNMVLVITDIKAKKVLAVLDDTTNATLKAWFASLPEGVKEKIKWVSTDMNKWYKNVVEAKVKWVVSTVDKYHLVQEANKMVDDVRKMTIWLTKMWFMKEEDFIKNKKVTKKLLSKKKEKEVR